MHKIKTIYFVFLIFLIYLTISGSRCSSTNEPVIPPDTVSPPTKVSIIVDAFIAGNSFALIKWENSADEDKSDFKGYIAVTYRVDPNGISISKFDSAVVLKNEQHQRMLSSISRSVRYKTYVYAINERGTISSPVSTPIFAGIYRNNDGVIDEYKDTLNNKAGYGWDPLNGVGTQYSFNSSNLNDIDLICKSYNKVLSLYSPKAHSSLARDTKFSQVPGSKQTAFDTIEGLIEPFLSGIGIAQDNVYLIKTQDSIYIKLWVKNIKTVGTAPYDYKTVEFEYKVQPIQNLLALKR